MWSEIEVEIWKTARWNSMCDNQVVCFLKHEIHLIIFGENHQSDIKFQWCKSFKAILSETSQNRNLFPPSLPAYYCPSPPRASPQMSLQGPSSLSLTTDRVDITLDSTVTVLPVIYCHCNIMYSTVAVLPCTLLSLFFPLLYGHCTTL